MNIIQNLKKLKTLQKTDVKNKKVVVRLDLNVPMKNGVIADTARIDAAKRTLDYLIEQGAKIVILSHLSRIKSDADITSGKKSLAPVAEYLQKLYHKHKVSFEKDNTSKSILTRVNKMKSGDIIVLENTRYNDLDLKTNTIVKLESKCNLDLAKFWASLGEVFVNDAFATIHRKHASNHGIASFSKKYCIGFLIQSELESILKFNAKSPKPIVSIIGGAKISDKIILLNKLMKLSDYVLIGGGMSYTFQKALGYEIGTSLCEDEMMATAKAIYDKYKKKIILPVDYNVTLSFEDKPGKIIDLHKDKFGKYSGMDCGPKTTKMFTNIISKAGTIFWNGPTGVFEFKNFEDSTRAIAIAVTQRTREGGFSLIGGGDTASAACIFANKRDYSFVSTGGGATLAIIQEDNLPGLFVKAAKPVREKKLAVKNKKAAKKR